MNQNRFLSQITLEVETVREGALVIGPISFFYSNLVKALQNQTLEVNNFANFQYVFMVGDYQSIEGFLVKATEKRAKFFLILSREKNSKDQKKAASLTRQFFKEKNLDGKIIFLESFKNGETEAILQILRKCFSPNEEPDEGQKKISINQKVFSFGRFFKPGLIILLVIFSPVIYFFGNLLLAGLLLNQSQRAIVSSNFTLAKIAVESSQGFFSNSLAVARFFPFSQLTSGLEAGENLSLAAGHLAQTAQESQQMAKDIFSSETIDLTKNLNSLGNNISLAEEELALAEARGADLPVFKNDLVKVAKLRQSLLKIKNLWPVLPSLLGFDKPKTYLLLLANNFELRPGGGFIGTVGFLTFDNGKARLKIEDVYTLDGQLKGHVEPPGPIKEYLNQPHWYLRDSNFDPDFSVNAPKAIWFAEKEMGINLDGAIGVDLSLVEKILQITGPMDVPDYREKLTAENFFFKTQTRIQTNFFPGSTEKKDFIGATAQGLFTKLTSEKNLPYLKLAQAVQNAFGEKHLMLYWTDPLIEELTLRQQWGGGVAGTTAQQCEKCLDDYLMVVDANLGVNKVNYFVKKEISKEVNFKENGVDSTVTINYQNASPVGVNFGGDYKNYLRILSGKGWGLQKVTVGGVEVKKIDREEVDGKDSAGFLITVPAGQNLSVTVYYHQNLDPANYPINYQVLIQKQSGTDKDKFNLIINSNLGVVEKELLRYNGELLVDKAFEKNIRRDP